MQTPKTPLLPILPMHLMLSLGCWLSSPFGLQCAKKGLLPLNLAAQLGPKNLHAAGLQSALEKEAKNRAAELLSGILRYSETPYVRHAAEPPVIWQRENAKLLDYGQKVVDAQALVLFILS